MSPQMVTIPFPPSRRGPWLYCCLLHASPIRLAQSPQPQQERDRPQRVKGCDFPCTDRFLPFPGTTPEGSEQSRYLTDRRAGWGSM